MAKADGDRTEKLDEAIRYGMAYRDGFLKLQDPAQLAHKDASYLDEAIVGVKDIIDGVVKDHQAAMRVLGSVCQQIKVCLLRLNFVIFSKYLCLFQSMREAAYSKPLDAKFK